MLSLADELLNDLDNIGGDLYVTEEDEEQLARSKKRKTEDLNAMYEDEHEADEARSFLFFPGGAYPDEELDEGDVRGMELGLIADIQTVAELDGSKRMSDIMRDIEKYASQPLNATAMSPGNPETVLLVLANNLSADIEIEIPVVQKFIRDHYHTKFPELEQLVIDPVMFIRAVRAIGNGDDLSGGTLRAILPSAIAMTVTIAATTTKGQRLAETAWHGIQKACELADRLENANKKIFNYVQSRISVVAPNLSTIVGATIAARLLGAAGGLSALVNMPTCNVLLLGRQKKITAGFSTTLQNQHSGFIMQSELVQATPPKYRPKAQRVVGLKCTRAASMDLHGRETNGAYGRILREEAENILQKLVEPPPARLVKALTIPNDGQRSQRGGKSARKAKAASAPTERSKMQNRVMFGEAEEEVGAFDHTKGIGMIGTRKVRSMAVDDRTKAKMSRRNKVRTQTLTRASTSSQAGISGITSSLSFTPGQCLEIIKPQATAAGVKATKERWFS